MNVIYTCKNINRKGAFSFGELDPSQGSFEITKLFNSRKKINEKQFRDKRKKAKY